MKNSPLAPASALVEPFLDVATETFSYVVYDAPGGQAAVIDPVLNFDPASGRTSTAGVERILSFVAQHSLTVIWILETHAHADHLSAAPFVRERLGGKIGIGDKIREVQQIFHKVFNLGPKFICDGSQFDHLFSDGETFRIGKLDGKVIHTPGHTPADMSWLIGGVLFVGDTLFMPDAGTARCDFPGGSARTLYRSIQTLLAFPPQTPIYICHDYPPEGRSHQCLTTVAAQKQNNIHVRDGISEAKFVAMREARDAGLDMPRLILPSIQVNIRAGALPPAEDNGVVYLKLPVNRL